LPYCTLPFGSPIKSISNDCCPALQNQLTIEHLERRWAIFERLHTAGLYLGDAKLANFLAADDGKVWVLDFETAGVIGDKPSPIRTFDIKPEFSDVCTADLAHFLASVLYPYDEDDRDGREGRNFDLRIWAARDSETAIAAWAREKLRKFLN
jgi:aminoglycoside phosphotransferase (APT) family kinase protein